jgi:hypothetical protein
LSSWWLVNAIANSIPCQQTQLRASGSFNATNTTRRTGLSDQQEKPNAPGQIHHQGHGIARASQKSNDGVEGFGDLSRYPGSVGVGD